MLNKAQLIGHVGKDPDIRQTESGVKVASFTLATTDKAYTLPNGTQVPERTEWHNIVAWRGLAEVIEKYVKKGDKLYIEGKIRTRNYDKDNVKHYVTEIFVDSLEMLSSKQAAQQQPAQQSYGQGYQPQQYQQPAQYGQQPKAAPQQYAPQPQYAQQPQYPPQNFPPDLPY